MSKRHREHSYRKNEGPGVYNTSLSGRTGAIKEINKTKKSPLRFRRERVYGRKDEGSGIYNTSLSGRTGALKEININKGGKNKRKTYKKK